nr:hypothetical protein [Tanacetum cinerariifolium]
RVLALEKTKTTQALEIDSLKRKDKKLEKKQKSRTHKFKRLYKVGLVARVDSSKDEPNLGKGTSKQGRIEAIDVDEDITLVNDQDAKMFDVTDLHGEEVFVDNDDADKKGNVASEINAARIATTISAAATITTKEATLAKALVELKASKPKVKGVFIQELSESITTITTTIVFSKKSQDKGKGIMVEEPLKPKKKDQKRRKFFVAKAVEEKRNKPPTQAQQRKIMCTYLENMEGKKLKDLKNMSFDFIQKMFDKAFKRVNTFKPISLELVEGSLKRPVEEIKQKRSKNQKGDLNTMFEPNVKDQVWKKQHGYKVLEWKLYDSCGVHSLRMQ